MAKRQLKWEMHNKAIKVSWINETTSPLVFEFKDLPDYKEQLPIGITFEFFRHGLKQKLADCIAGAAKNGATIAMQQTTMTDLWAEFCKGNFTSRKAAVQKFTKADIAKQAKEVELSAEEMKVLEKLGLA